MKTRLSFILVLWLVVVAVLPAALAAPGQPASGRRVFKAGAATSNITPFLGDGIVGGWTTPPATHIHDELHVRCLALDDGGTRLVFAVVDSVSVNREVFDEAKRLIHEATGIRFLVRRIADGVRRAVNQLEPARLGWGVGRVPQHVFNRRWLLKDGKTVPNPFGGQDRALMNPGHRPDLLQPAGPVNPEVYFLSVQSTNGRPIALLANYWLHYVGGVGSGHISADYFGAFADRIQQLLGADRQDPPFVGMLANGPCGDVNNINYAAPATRRFAPYEKIRLVADDVAQEIMRVYRTMEHRDWVELKAAAAELELKLRQPTPEMLRRAQEILARPATVSPLHRHEETYARRTLAARDWPESIRVVLQTFRIGEIGIAAIPFEVFTEIGLEIRDRSPFRPTFTIELANGGYGYLPTPEQHELGGYETWLGTNRVEMEASRKIVAQILQLFSRVK
jgi:neutral ceramidase